MGGIKSLILRKRKHQAFRWNAPLIYFFLPTKCSCRTFIPGDYRYVFLKRLYTKMIMVKNIS